MRRVLLWRPSLLQGKESLLFEEAEGIFKHTI
jgi:hypothetical protein